MCAPVNIARGRRERVEEVRFLFSSLFVASGRTPNEKSQIKNLIYAISKDLKYSRLRANVRKL